MFQRWPSLYHAKNNICKNQRDILSIDAVSDYALFCITPQDIYYMYPFTKYLFSLEGPEFYQGGYSTPGR